MRSWMNSRRTAENSLDYLRNWKSRTGNKILGYFCTNTPEEIIHAAGLLPGPDLELPHKHLSGRPASPELQLLARSKQPGSRPAGRPKLPGRDGLSRTPAIPFSASRISGRKTSVSLSTGMSFSPSSCTRRAPAPICFRSSPAFARGSKHSSAVRSADREPQKFHFSLQPKPGPPEGALPPPPGGSGSFYRLANPGHRSMRRLHAQGGV